MKLWHELEVGTQISTESRTVSADEVREFALEFDPQPYHLDAEAAANSIFGDLCASGWQANAITMQLLTDALQHESVALMGVRSVKRCRWKLPLFVGDTVTAKISLESKCDDLYDSRFGICLCSVVLENQNEKPVLLMDTELLISKKCSD
ncbi:MAG: MaoC/PaaZ C-terminal domain-containing protein [Pseudomonadales bacterium]